MMLRPEHGRRSSDDRIIAYGRQQDELDGLTKISHKASHEGLLQQQIKEKTAEGDEDDQWTRMIGR